MIDIEEIIEYSLDLKLLYVEDNEVARDAAIEILEDFFDDIIIAIDGVDGVEKFMKDMDFDIIIADINMPRLNGLEMAKKIKEIDKEIIILIFSAHSESNYFMDSIKLGVDGYLIKPIDIDQFVEVLEKIVKKLRVKDKEKEDLNFLTQYQNVIDENSIISKTDTKGVITYVNENFCELCEYTKEELIGQNHNILRDPDAPISIYKDLWRTIKNHKKTWQGMIKNRSKSGKSYYIKTTIKPILDEDGNLKEFLSIRDDITDIMNPKKQLNYLMELAEETIVVLLKISEFDDIQKVYGENFNGNIEDKFGDEIFEMMPKRYNFERIFILGDGKYLFAKDKKNSILTINNMISELKKFQKIINLAVFRIDEIDYDISITISFAYGKNALESAKYGMSELDISKQDFIVANSLIDEAHSKAEQNIKTLKMIKKAIEDYKIISYFQPIINNRTRKIEKYESLVRLIDENGDVISPFFFLDTAKKGKYYAQITSMVLENSFSALKNTNMEISINLSALDIEKKSTRDELYKLLKYYEDKTSRVVFELLEDEKIRNFLVIDEFITNVKRQGVQIAIDDFGTGYSNFERILHYQPDIVKIDGYLIKNLEKDKFSLSVVRTIVAFAKEQNIKTIAEFVENENIYNILNNLGVDYSQGYYFGKPEILKQ